MKTYSVEYYLIDMLHSKLIDAENESDCILNVIKSLPYPEIMHDFKIKIYSKGKDAVVSAKQVCKLEERIEELEIELQQYKAYVSDITAAIQKNICKDFFPNIEPSAN